MCVCARGLLLLLINLYSLQFAFECHLVESHFLLSIRATLCVCLSVNDGDVMVLFGMRVNIYFLPPIYKPNNNSAHNIRINHWQRWGCVNVWLLLFFRYFVFIQNTSIRIRTHLAIRLSTRSDWAVDFHGIRSFRWYWKYRVGHAI